MTVQQLLSKIGNWTLILQALNPGTSEKPLFDSFRSFQSVVRSTETYKIFTTWSCVLSSRIYPAWGFSWQAPNKVLLNKFLKTRANVFSLYLFVSRFLLYWKQKNLKFTESYSNVAPQTTPLECTFLGVHNINSLFNLCFYFTNFSESKCCHLIARSHRTGIDFQMINNLLSSCPPHSFIKQEFIILFYEPPYLLNCSCGQRYPVGTVSVKIMFYLYSREIFWNKPGSLPPGLCT